MKIILYVFVLLVLISCFPDLPMAQDDLLNKYNAFTLSNDVHLKFRDREIGENKDLEKNVNLSLSLEKDVYGVCEPIILSVTFENISSEDVICYTSGYSVLDYWPFLANEKNETVPHTFYGKNFFKDVDNSLMDIVLSVPKALKPSGKQQISVTVNRFYDITCEGKYSLYVRKLIVNKDRTGYCILDSASLTFEVKECPDRPTMKYITDDTVLPDNSLTR